MKVLSEIVANGLQFTFKEETRETANFVEKVDKFFDCFNVINFTEFFTKSKPYRMPYRNGEDFRLKVLY